MEKCRPHRILTHRGSGSSLLPSLKSSPFIPGRRRTRGAPAAGQAAGRAACSSLTSSPSRLCHARRRQYAGAGRPGRGPRTRAATLLASRAAPKQRAAALGPRGLSAGIQQEPRTGGQEGPARLTWADRVTGPGRVSLAGPDLSFRLGREGSLVVRVARGGYLEQLLLVGRAVRRLPHKMPLITDIIHRRCPLPAPHDAVEHHKIGPPSGGASDDTAVWFDQRWSNLVKPVAV